MLKGGAATRLGMGSGLPNGVVLLILLALDVVGIFLFPSWLAYVLFIVPPVLVVLWLALRNIRSRGS